MRKLRNFSAITLCIFIIFSFSCYKKLEICPDNGERNEFKIEVSSVSINSGKFGENIEINGRNFIGGNDNLYEVLFFGNVNATNIEVINSNTIKATIPPKPLHAPLESIIKVKYNGACPETATAPDKFYYEYQIVKVDSICDKNIFGDLKGLTNLPNPTGVDIFVTDITNSVIHSIEDNFSTGLIKRGIYAGQKKMASSNDAMENLDHSLLNAPNDIALFKGNDDQFITDNGNRQIRRINKVQGTNGKIFNSAGNRNLARFLVKTPISSCDKSFTVLEGLAVNHNNKVYISDSGLKVIYELTPNLSAPTCEFLDPNRIPNLGDSGIVKVQIDLSTLPSSPEPYGLAIGEFSSGIVDLLIALPFNNQIIRYNLNDSEIRNIITLNERDQPKDIVIDTPTGTIFFIDENNNSIGYYNSTIPISTNKFTKKILRPQGITLAANIDEILLYVTTTGGLFKFTIQ